MPELPEAETIVRVLRPRLTGRRIERVELRIGKLHEPLDRRRLRRICTGRRVSGVVRRGKGIIVELADGGAILVNLGMTGVCRLCPATRPLAKHELVIFRLDDGGSWRFEDSRRFGMVQAWRRGLDPAPAFLGMLGPEPFSRDFSGSYLHRLLHGRRCSIKELLLDQRRVAGIGNIYASESLHRAGIDPRRASGSLSRGECDRVVSAVRAVLRAAIRAGGTTISDYRDPDGGEGRFIRYLRVYGRSGESCRRCGGTIVGFRQGGRSTYACPDCQT
jgi:formamidopyrimidine-DNA glycosylase